MFAGCGGIPKGIAPITDFDIAIRGLVRNCQTGIFLRKGFKRVTASYSLRDDGGIDVTNRGRDVGKGKWRTARGKAYAPTARDIGYLKVSFFGPFYASYVVFDLDKAGYQYSFVTGPDRNYLWLLARAPHVNEEVLKEFIQEADSLGFDTEKPIYVKHHPQALQCRATETKGVPELNLILSAKQGEAAGRGRIPKNRDRRSGHPQRGKCATRASAWGLHRLFINFLDAGRSSKTPGNEIGRGLKQICNEIDQFQKLKPKQGFKDLSTTFPSACPRLMGKTDWIDARPWCFPASGRSFARAVGLREYKQYESNWKF